MRHDSLAVIVSNLDYWQRKLELAQADVDTAERQVAAWMRELERSRTRKVERGAS